MAFRKILLIICVITLLTACEIKEWNMPAWETEWKVAAFNDSWTMREMLEDVDDMNVTDSSIFYTYSDTLERQYFNDEIQLTNYENVIVQNIDYFRINSPGENSTNIRPWDIDSGLQPTPNPVPIPQIDFDVARGFAPFPNFNWADIHEGELEVTVSNDMGFDFDFVIVRMIDIDQGNSVVGETNLGYIAYGNSESGIIPLNNRRLSNNLSAQILGRIHAGNGQIFDTSELSVIAEISDLTITAAHGDVDGGDIDPIENPAKIQEEGISRINYLRITNDASIINLEIANHYPIEQILRITINDIYTDENMENPLILNNVHLYPGEVTHRNINLENCTINPLVVGDTSFIRVSAQGEYLPFSGVISAEEGDIVIRTTIPYLEFNEISVELNNKSVDIERSQNELDFGDIPEDVYDLLFFTDVKIYVYYSTEVDVEDIDFHLHMVGKRENAPPQIFDHFIEDISPGENNLIEINNENTNNQLGEFISYLPDTVIYEGIVFLDGEALLTDQAYFDAHLDVESRLRFEYEARMITIDQDVLDSTGIEIDSSDSPKVDNIKFISLELELENHTVLGLDSMQVIFSDDFHRLYDQSYDRVVVEVDEWIRIGEIDNNGFVTEPYITPKIVIPFDREKIDYFSRDNATDFYYGMQFKFTPENTQSVEVMSTDYIRATGYLNIKAIISEDLTD